MILNTLPCWTLQIPPDYKLQTMIADLGDWLSSEHGMETDARPVDDAVIIEARARGWKVTRMLKRRAEALFIVFRQDDELHVAFANDDPSAAIGDGNAGRSSGILGLASRAVGSTVDLAGDVADGLADALTEKKTPTAILAFIHDYVAERFIAAGCPVDLEADPKRSPFTDAPSAMEANWLRSRLQPGEIVLAWMETSTRPPSATVDWRFLLTSHQAVLAAVSDRGLEAVEALPPAEMAVTDVIGRDTVMIGRTTFRTCRANDGLFRAIAPLVPLGPEGRIAGAARLVFAHRKGGDDRGPHALFLLDRLCGMSDDPLHRLARFYVDSSLKADKAARGAFDGDPLPPDFADMTAALPERASPGRLRDWADAWSMPAWDQLTLGGFIAGAHPDSVPHAEVAAPLLTEVRDRLMTESKNSAVHTLADITAARNLKRRGLRAEAARILEDRLSYLPDESLSDLLPAREADLTRGEGGQLIRVNILELLADLRGDPDHPDPATLAELASLQPLVDERLRDLAAAGPDLKRAAETVLSLLGTGGLDPGPSDPEAAPEGGAAPLKKTDIENRLRHPSAREGTVFNKIQSMLASKTAPDHGVLKSYARRVTPEKHPNLSTALADGARLLGMGAVEGYIAFGDLNTGVRGYEGKPPFLLVGGDHLEADSPFFLTPAERRFLIGAELAHIRFGHDRVTSREVWEGVFNKAMTAVELFPVFGTYLGKVGRLGKFAGKAADAARKASGIHGYLSKARSAASTASNLYGRFGGGGTDDSVGEDEGNLIGAFRAMQLTADRAALVLCGDLRAAVRAMFLSSRRLQPELGAARRGGLRAFLSRTDDSGEPVFQDLAIRIAALISFYLSEEYRGLRGEGFPAD